MAFLTHAFLCFFIGYAGSVAATLLGLWLAMLVASEVPGRFSWNFARSRQSLFFLACLRRLRENPFRVNCFRLRHGSRLSLRFSSLVQSLCFILFSIAFMIQPGIDLIFILIMVILAADSIVDVLTRILPDSLALLLLPLFVVHSGMDFERFWSMFPVSIIFICLLCILWFFGKGRGDLKLVAVMVLGMGPVFAASVCAVSFCLLLAARICMRLAGIATGLEMPMAPFFCVSLALINALPISSYF